MLKNWTILSALSPDVRKLIAAWGFISLGYYGIVGVLVNLYLLRLGYGIEFIGLFIAAGQGLWAAAALPIGALSRRIGLRTALILSPTFTGVGIGLMLLVEMLPSDLWTVWLLGGWLMAWIGATLLNVSSAPYLMLAARPEERNIVFSAQSAIIAFMGFAGGIIAGLAPTLAAGLLGLSLEDAAPYRIGLWLAPIANLCAVWLLMGISPLRVKKQDATQTAAKPPIRLLALLAAIVFLQAAGGGAARTFFNVFLDIGLRVPPAQIGAIMGIAQLLPVFAAMFAPQLLNRFGSATTLAIAGGGLMLSLLLLGIADHWLLAGIAFAVVVTMVGVSGIAYNIFGQELVHAQWRTISAAVVSIGLAVGWAMTAGVGGYLVEAVGFRNFFFLCALLVFGSVLVITGYNRGRRTVPAPAPSAAE